MIEIREIRMNEVVKLLNMVRETIRVSLKKEYPQSVIEKLLQDYDVDSFLKHSYNQKIFIALFNDQIIGTASILDNQIRNVFVHRNHQRKGVGKLLLKYLEEIIRDKKYSYVTVPANPFAYEFYQKLGYFIVKEEYNEFYGIVEYIIRKTFISSILLFLISSLLFFPEFVPFFYCIIMNKDFILASRYYCFC